MDLQVQLVPYLELHDAQYVALIIFSQLHSEIVVDHTSE